jgi:outer membrane protein
MLKNTIFAILFVSISTRAQELLTLEQALEVALKSNYSIQIAKSEARIDHNNASLGNAGFLPQIAASGSRTHTVMANSHQEFLTGSVQDRSNAVSDADNLGVSLNWTLFDGFAMFTNLQKLRELRNMGEIQARQAIENTVSQVINNYFDIVQQKQKYQAMKEALTISEQRLKLSEANYDLGSLSHLEVLDARVDLNADRSALLNEEIVLHNSKTTLNQLLAREVDTQFDVADSISLHSTLALEKLQQDMLKNNSTLMLAQKNCRVAGLDVREAWSSRFPRIGLYAGYTKTQSEAQAGFLHINRSDGYNYGVSASITLFDGFNIHRQWQNARVLQRTNELVLAEMQNSLQAQLSLTFEKYRSNKELVKMEAENVNAARENVKVSMEKFKLGSITALQFRDVQKKYLDAASRLISAQYQAKSAEVELLRLSGGLVK